jgi:hypothetical protein
VWVPHDVALLHDAILGEQISDLLLAETWVDAGDEEVGSWVDCVLVVAVLAWWVTRSMSVQVFTCTKIACHELTGQRVRSWARRGSWRHRRGLGRASESAHVHSRDHLQYPTVSHVADQVRLGYWS